MPTLADLLTAVPDARLVRGDPLRPIAGVSHDTRSLREGELFVAIPGSRFNGLDLVPEAVSRGASGIVAESMPVLFQGGPTWTAPSAPSPEARSGADLGERTASQLPIVLVPSARAALADLAAAFWGHPSRRISVVGITGTDGKTTTAHLLSQILEARGLRTGWLSTVNTKVSGEIRANASEHTTPEAPVVQRTLVEMAASDVDVAILETSSHALAMHRVRGTLFRVGVFTNLSPEHANFHGTFEAYREVKTRLFADLPPDGLAVLNADDPSSAAMGAVTRAPLMTYALDAPADVRATDISLTADGTTFTVHLGRSPERGSGPDASVTVTTRLVGRFNVANWLAAYCAATYFGATPDDLRRAAERQGPVPGRMNLVQRGQPFLVVVDFAHTPRALADALDAVRPLVSGRVMLLFGLPGERDLHNRAVSGQIAAAKSDFFVITTEDPYEEDPTEIARQIARGADSAGAVEGRDYVVDLDRRAALRRLLQQAAPGDAVLLAGHGHLDYLVIGPDKLPWNDADVVGDELRTMGYDE